MIGPGFLFTTYLREPPLGTQIEPMFGLFKKDPVKKLEKRYSELLQEAMALQRGGDIKGYAAKSAEAEEVMKQIEAHRNGTQKA